MKYVHFESYHMYVVSVLVHLKLWGEFHREGNDTAHRGAWTAPLLQLENVGAFSVSKLAMQLPASRFRPQPT